MENNKFWQGIKRAYFRYDRMMEKQGFYVVLAVCVIVIVLSAVYTFRLRDGDSDLPAQDAQSVGGSQQGETLAQALVVSQAAPAIVPTEPPFSLIQPVAGFLDRAFDIQEPQFFSQASVWQVHPGIDIQVEYGKAVTASAKGTVTSVRNDNQLGLMVVLDHGNGYQTLYAGLHSADYVKVGDPVYQGQTIGHAGNGVLCESDALPHLHFEVRRDGKPVDPLAAFLGLDN